MIDAASAQTAGDTDRHESSSARSSPSTAPADEIAADRR